LGHVGTLRTFSDIGVSRSGSARRRKERKVPVPRETVGIYRPERITFEVGIDPLPTPEESGAGVRAPWGALRVRKATGLG
jgi:hypothetical protein